MHMQQDHSRLLLGALQPKHNVKRLHDNVRADLIRQDTPLDRGRRQKPLQADSPSERVAIECGLVQGYDLAPQRVQCRLCLFLHDQRDKSCQLFCTRFGFAIWKGYIGHRWLMQRPW